MLRAVITKLIRLSELKPSTLALFSIASVVASFLKDIYAPIVGPQYAHYLSIGALIFSLMLLLPIIVRDMNIWRWLPPRYNGVDELVAYLPSNLDAADYFFVGDDGRLRIDCEGFLRYSAKLLERSVFIHTDEQLHQIGAFINAKAFSGSRYGLSIENKRARNSAIGAKHAASFALLRESPQEDAFLGLASTIPLSEQSMAAYVAGNISDNDFNAEMTAIPKDPVGGVVFFLIAHDRKKGSATQNSLAARALEDLIRLSVVQAVLIAAAAGGQERFMAIAANSEPKMRRLFERLKLVDRPDLKSADQEAMYANYIHMRNLSGAREYLSRIHPELAKKLHISP